MSDRTSHLITAAGLALVVATALAGGELRMRNGPLRRTQRPARYWLVIGLAAVAAVLFALSGFGLI
jgi:hypothetical protein